MTDAELYLRLTAALDHACGWPVLRPKQGVVLVNQDHCGKGGNLCSAHWIAHDGDMLQRWFGALALSDTWIAQEMAV